MTYYPYGSAGEDRAPHFTPPPYPHLPAPPSVALTIVITLFFGIFGLIPAFSGASKAEDVGAPTEKYWVAFWLTLLVPVLLLAVAAAGA